MPPGLWLTYYGDDFTGASDVLEVLAAAGVNTLLFLDAPTPEDMRRYPEARVVGVAGRSRSQSPAWMRAHLPPMFQALRALGAPLNYYKVCSTFDSAPEIGSIGGAIDLGIACFGGSWSPMIVGTPRLGRYSAFGHLFAAGPDGATHRLDRHPTMAQHPVTPMNEADLRVHLAKQTTRRIDLIDFVALQAGANAPPRHAAEAPVVLLDVLDTASLEAAGAMVWTHRASGPFSASASGLADALVAQWRRLGMLPLAAPLPVRSALTQVFAVSGSCSPNTAAQIDFAERAGFCTLRLDVRATLRNQSAAEAAVLARALEAWARGQSVLIYSARGPLDPAVSGFDQVCQSLKLVRQDAAERVAQSLAALAAAFVTAATPKRLLIAGGDSSGAITEALGVKALAFAAPLVAGAPLCRARSERSAVEGLEIALKGGQMGGADFFVRGREGG